MAAIQNVRWHNGKEAGQVIGLAVVLDCPTESEASKLASHLFLPTSPCGANLERIEVKPIGSGSFHVAVYYRGPGEPTPEHDFNEAIKSGQFSFAGPRPVVSSVRYIGADSETLIEV